MEPAAQPLPPNNIALLLHAVRILLDYGRHLLDTVRHRATAPNFNAIAACFGTANLSTILAHLNRGILRAAALERMLLARAATGRDIDVVEPPHPRATSHQPAAADAPNTAARPTPRPQPPRHPAPPAGTIPNSSCPPSQDLERQVRRRPLGRTIFDICLDLAVVPGFCTGEFWNELFEIMHSSAAASPALMQQKSRREQAFAKQQDSNPRQQLGLVASETRRRPPGPRLLHRRTAGRSRYRPAARLRLMAGTRPRIRCCQGLAGLGQFGRSIGSMALG